MAEEKENIIEEVSNDTTEQVEQPVETTTEQPRDEKGQFKSKFESAGDDSVIKVDLSKPPPIKESEEVKQEEPTKEENIDVVKESETKEEVIEEEQPVLEEITDGVIEEVKSEVEEAIAETQATGKPLPENVQKLVNFMEETGGDLNDYVNLNRDVSKMDDSEVLDEYYRTTKSHLTPEERSFLLEDTFGVDEDIDDEKTIRKKKIALKEQVAEAKTHLDGQKSKYYEDIKAGSKLTQDQQKAIDFFNRYNKESKEAQKIAKANESDFNKKTNNVFNDKFKGFEYNVGDKKFRFNVKDVDSVKQSQSDNDFFKKFLNKNNELENAGDFHKGLFTATNADAIANHFYEQGKTDAMKDSVARAKNVNMNPRQNHGEIEAGGIKVRVLGENSDDFKFKIKQK